MTNSEAAKPSTTTGTEAPTSQDEGKYLSNKGTEFEIRQLPNGLYMIFMLSGGKKPDICNGKFTGYNLAQNELVKYLKKGNRTGYAVFPDKIGK